MLALDKPDAGRALARMWWRDHRYCVRVLAQLRPHERQLLAQGTDLTGGRVLAV